VLKILRNRQCLYKSVKDLLFGLQFIFIIIIIIVIFYPGCVLQNNA